MSLISTPHRTFSHLDTDLNPSTRQAKLFRHLAGTMCQLCERIEWHELERSEQRRLRRTVGTLSACIHGAQGQLTAARRSRTTKAAFRKR